MLNISGFEVMKHISKGLDATKFVVVAYRDWETMKQILEDGKPIETLPRHIVITEPI